ncbi:MAG: response regulator [Terriglobia bacterium]
MATNKRGGKRKARKPEAGKRVLAIDTDGAFLTAVQRMVESGSCRVDLARTAEEARAYIARHQYDLVISDLAMPEIDAAELCECLKERLREGTRLLFLASRPPVAAMRAFLEARHLVYLEKPVHLRRFLDKLDDVLGSEEEAEEAEEAKEAEE